MSKREDYRATLRALEGDWVPYLLAESGLPGPRGNIELAQAVADEGDAALFERLLSYGPDVAPVNTAEEFLPFCGVVGLGRLAAEGDLDRLPAIRACANDPRWRMREGVAMALQRLGARDMETLLSKMARWAGGTPLEQRAAAAALCEPALLKDADHARRTLEILEAITATVAEVADRRSEDFKALRKGLAYCWSVAIAALPEAGKPTFERWLESDDPDLRWIVKQNLGKARLARMDAEWVERCKERL